MYVFTHKVPPALESSLTLALTADERNRSRYRYSICGEITDATISSTNVTPVVQEVAQSIDIYIELPRGTTLRGGDCLGGEGHAQVLRIVSKPEPVLTVRAMATDQPALWLLRAAYHLGNRHVALEVGADYLRLAPDPVLESMLHQLRVTVTSEMVPFQPESGAYGHHH